MLAVSALTFALGTLAVVLPGAGGSAATAAGPPQRWQPAPDARWQYQLESSNRRLASTGGISVGICQVPHSGGRCVRPDVFDIDLYVDGQVSGNDHTINTRGGGRHPRSGRRTRSVTCRRAPRSTSAPTTTGTSTSTAHHHSLIGKPFSRRFPNEYWLNLNNDRGSATSSCGSRGPHPQVRQRPASTASSSTSSTPTRRADSASPAGTSAPTPARSSTRRSPRWRTRHGLSVGAQERPRPGAQARAAVRLRDQRAVLPVPRVHEQPVARLQGVHCATARRSSRSSTASRRPLLQRRQRASGSARSRRRGTSRRDAKPWTPCRVRRLGRRLARIHDPGRDQGAP